MRKREKERTFIHTCGAEQIIIEGDKKSLIRHYLRSVGRHRVEYIDENKE